VGLIQRLEAKASGLFFIAFQPKQRIFRQFQPVSKLDYGTKAAIYPRLAAVAAGN
jgi:hypothetical protein